MLRSDLALCVLAIAITFPGHNRFKDRSLHAGMEILGSWLTQLAILWLCGYATNSLSLFSKDVLLTWALVTPLLQWLAVATGRAILRRRAAQPALRHSAIVVGAGPLGFKLARNLQESREEGHDFAG